MKRFISLILLSHIVLSFSACGIIKSFGSNSDNVGHYLPASVGIINSNLSSNYSTPSTETIIRFEDPGFLSTCLNKWSSTTRYLGFELDLGSGILPGTIIDVDFGDNIFVPYQYPGNCGDVTFFWIELPNTFDPITDQIRIAIEGVTYNETQLQAGGLIVVINSNIIDPKIYPVPVGNNK